MAGTWAPAEYHTAARLPASCVLEAELTCCCCRSNRGRGHLGRAAREAGGGPAVLRSPSQHVAPAVGAAGPCAPRPGRPPAHRSGSSRCPGARRSGSSGGAAARAPRWALPRSLLPPAAAAYELVAWCLALAVAAGPCCALRCAAMPNASGARRAKRCSIQLERTIRKSEKVA